MVGDIYQVSCYPISAHTPLLMQPRRGGPVIKQLYFIRIETSTGNVQGMDRTLPTGKHDTRCSGQFIEETHSELYGHLHEYTLLYACAMLLIVDDRPPGCLAERREVIGLGRSITARQLAGKKVPDRVSIFWEQWSSFDIVNDQCNRRITIRVS
jgi:hypothetical protein